MHIFLISRLILIIGFVILSLSFLIENNDSVKKGKPMRFWNIYAEDIHSYQSGNVNNSGCLLEYTRITIFLYSKDTTFHHVL